MLARKSIKSVLVVSLLTSSIAYTPNSKAGVMDVVVPAVVVTGLATLGAGLVALQTYFAYQRGKEQYEILKEFHENPYLTYENLTQDARNHYYDHCGASSTSVASDYPVIWLEKDATANKNLLAWMFFSENMKKLSKDLAIVLNYLRSVQRFQEERKEFNEKYRQEKYREERIALEREKVELQREQGRR